MSITPLQFVYPHHIHGVITSFADTEERAETADLKTALSYIDKMTCDIRKRNAWGCFHVTAFGKYSLCVSMESNGIVDLMYYHIPTDSVIKTTGLSRSQIRKLKHIIREHFEGTSNFDNQIEAIYRAN